MALLPPAATSSHTPIASPMRRQALRSPTVDKSSFAGLAIGVGGIVAGLLLEGGKISQIVQPTAAMIVFGGTLGAVMLQFPLPLVGSAFRRLANVFFEPKLEPQQVIRQLLVFANKARKEGIVSLDADLS